MPNTGQYLGDLRGRGLFWGVEIVQSPLTKKPFDPKHQLHARIKREAMQRGLMVYPMGGTVDGRYGDHVVLAPPFVISEAQIEEVANLLVESISCAIQSI
jgi:adenosylmethionine-8-amino-7-oxononanoate aminotransferase